MDLQAAYNARQAQFIEARVKTKQEIEQFFESLKPIPPHVLEGITIPSDTRAEAIVPSMFCDPPNPEGYKAELEAFNILYTQVIARVDAINAKAEECLKNYA